MPSDIEYALFSTRVYAASDRNRTGVPAGWTELTWQADYNLSGFSAGAYRRGNEVVIAYTGTNESIDWLSNGLAGTGLLPAPQIFDAMRFYLEVKAANSDATSFTFTGHSLGAGLASLMAVFFDKQATVFDEAPFQPSAINPVLLASLQASLLLTGYSDLDFALYYASFGTLFPLREGNVSHIFLEGETLGTYRTGPTTIVGYEYPISMGNSTLDAEGRHAMTLLTAMLGNAAFKSVIQQLPNLATLLLDPMLFGVTDRRDPDTTDLLSSLLRRQYGAVGVPTDGRLDRFVADMQQLVGTDGLAQTNALVRDALMIASMEYFHAKTAIAATQLFTSDSYGLHFKYSDIGASSYKSLPMLVEAVNAFLTPEEQALLNGKLVRQDAWHIQSGLGGMITTGDRPRFSFKADINLRRRNMPRRARLALPNVPLHIIQRGHNRQACFFADEDYRNYLHWLGEYAAKTGCLIHAYVLMTNHVHLLISVERSESASALLKALGQRYVQYVNRSYRRSGTLWEGRFRSCLTQEESYLLSCQRYIELNPVRAGMVMHPAEYHWSSYRANAQGEVDALLRSHHLYEALGCDASSRQAAYRELFRYELEPDLVDEIRRATNGNYALGNERFAAQVAAALGQRAVPGKSGRPRRMHEAELGGLFDE